MNYSEYLSSDLNTNKLCLSHDEGYIAVASILGVTISYMQTFLCIWETISFALYRIYQVLETPYIKDSFYRKV